MYVHFHYHKNLVAFMTDKGLVEGPVALVHRCILYLPTTWSTPQAREEADI